jgi:enolase-phosphatase E1
VVLLDVEGTTTPISFVSDVLFPYARSHLRAYLRAHASDPEVKSALQLLRAECATDGSAPDTVESFAEYAESLMDRDSKSTGLKMLQGLIWKVGFASGALRGEVFDDVPPALRRWREAGLRTAIYSSGSVLSQKLLFASTAFGDLTGDLHAHFDTSVGPKRDPGSYRRIARELDIEPASLLFLSDVSAELDATRAAGCQVALTVRPGNSSQSAPMETDILSTFAEVETGSSDDR